MNLNRERLEADGLTRGEIERIQTYCDAASQARSATSCSVLLSESIDGSAAQLQQL